MIRGGGAVNDLAWLNDYAVARFVCECPIPVLTGIGHERDSTSLDEVAHLRFDTPSKAVAAIEQLALRRAREAQSAFDVIVGHGRRDTECLRAAVERLEREVKAAATSTVTSARVRCSQRLADLRLDAVHGVHRAAAQVQGLVGEVRYGATQCVAEARQQAPVALHTVQAEAFSALRTAKVRLDSAAPALLDRVGLEIRRSRVAVGAEMGSVLERSGHTVRDASNAAQALVREIAGQGPHKTLGRGFAIVRGVDGKTLTSAQSTASTQHIDIAFKDGTVHATVQNIQLGISDEILGRPHSGD